MTLRFISVQVLLNKDGSLKAQRVYAIPMPAVCSFYMQGVQQGENGENQDVRIGVMVQEWKTRDIMDNHPNLELLRQTMKKAFGIYWSWKTDGK